MSEMPMKQQQQQHALTEKQLRSARHKFDQLDADGNGTLKGAEMKRLADWIFESFHPNTHRSKTDKLGHTLMNRLDKDGDGRLSFDEFIAWYVKKCAEIKHFHISKKKNALSKHTDPNAPEPPLASEREKLWQLKLVKVHCAINMAVSILNFSTRGEILLKLVGGDYAQVAWYLSRWTSVTAAIEFLVNPTIGRLSDTYGRKPFMMLSPYAAIILKIWVLYKPSIMSLTIERIICDGLRTLSGTTMGSAAVTDIVAPSQIGVAFSGLYAWMGIAIIASPVIASRMTARTSYYAAIGLALVQLFTDQFCLKETLPISNRRAFAGVANPFTFTRLFTSGRSLAIASAVMAFQFMLDPKIMADSWYVLQLGALKWTRRQSQIFTGLLGLGLIFGRKITGVTMRRLGEHGHTTLTNTVTLLNNLLVGLFPSTPVQILSGFVGWVGGTRMNATKQMVTRVALDQTQTPSGFGRGELSGLTANLRALVVAISPMLYTRAYLLGLKAGNPGGAFVLAAFFAGLAEMCHRLLIGKLPPPQKKKTCEGEKEKKQQKQKSS